METVVLVLNLKNIKRLCSREVIRVMFHFSNSLLKFSENGYVRCQLLLSFSVHCNFDTCLKLKLYTVIQESVQKTSYIITFLKSCSSYKFCYFMYNTDFVKIVIFVLMFV